MKKHLIVILLLCLTFAVFAARKALVIGNSEYTSSPLRNPVNDARAMEKALRDLGFEVTTGYNLKDYREMLRLIQDFGAGLKEGSVGLFYYAGHGVQHEGVNYLIPTQANIRQDRDIVLEGVSLDWVLAEMDYAQNDLNIIILDACRNNPYASKLRSPKRGLAAPSIEKFPELLIAYATAPGGVAEDGTGSNGIYTEELLKNIKTPGLSLSQILMQTRKGVMSRTNGVQIPWDSSSLTEDFYFARATDQVPTTVQPSETKAPKVQTVHHYGSIVVTSSREADVYFDGSFVGKVSSAASLEIRDVIVGNHSIEARCSDKSETKKIYVIKNEKSEVHFASTTESTPTKLQPEKTREQTVPSYGWIKVTSSKKADVYLDGVFKDKIYPSAYLMIENVAAGSRSLELRTSDNSKTKSLDVIENQVSTANFVWVPDNMIEVGGGIFKMGSKNENDEQPLHEVTLAPFLICRYEVTQAEWKHVMGSNPSHWKGDKLPVEQVSWYDILKYCNLRSLEEGFTPCYNIAGSLNPVDWGEVPTSSNDSWDAVTCNFGANGYRLPTEAEWEFAARGGIKSEGYQYSGSQKLDSVAWYSDNSGNKTHKVGTKKANELGIYDMSGNLWEWCWDWYSDSYYGTSPKDNPAGPYTGNSRILRGGSWNITANSCRVSYRYGYDPYSSYYSYGFRVCRSAN